VETLFETISISIALTVGSKVAAVSTPDTAVVYIYSYSNAATAITAPLAADTLLSADATGGWTTVGNGGASPWGSLDGLGSADAVVGEQEYNSACDYAAAAPCDHDCKFGNGLETLFPVTGASPGVLRLNGSGHVIAVPAAVAAAFPSSSGSTALGVSMWVRRPSTGTTATAATGAGTTLLSYALPSSEPRALQLLLSDPDNLALLVADSYRIDSSSSPSGSERRGLRTGIAVPQDSAWHHVAVTWRASDGRVHGYLDGTKLYDGGPYAVGAAVKRAGSLVLGRGQYSGGCVWPVASSSTMPTPQCGFAADPANTGFTGDVQSLQLWNKFLTAADIDAQLHVPFAGDTAGLVLYWQFTPQPFGSSSSTSLYNAVPLLDARTGAAGALISSVGATLVEGTPSLNKGFPCGEVSKPFQPFDMCECARGLHH
jgi:Concanavalin A-like lectin/glucanases superfamily